MWNRNFREAAMAVTPRPHDKTSYQLIDDGKVVVGLAVQTDDDQWGLYDLDRNRIGRLSFDAPEEAAAHFDALRMAS